MWHLIAYDIRHPKRLQRVHRYLSQQAFALQKSVYLLPGKTTRLIQVLDELNHLINIREDDIRAYPIQHPDQLWLVGTHLPDGFMLGRSKQQGLLSRIKALFHA